MFIRLIALATALVTAPLAHAQQLQDQPQQTEPPLPLTYVSAGFAWSGELGLEIEAGLQRDIGDNLRIRFSPANISLIDGDVPRGYHWDGQGFGRDCIDDATNNITISDYCSAEVDTEWRAVLEGQLKLAPGMHFGGGVSYLMQGSFRPEDGRVAPFASFSWDAGEGMSVELRAGGKYAALSLRGLW